MAPSRAYVPSAAVLRALSRPRLIRCPLARRLPMQCARGVRTKVTPTAEPMTALKAAIRKCARESATEPLKEDELGPTRISELEWWEQDVDGVTPERFISRISNREDVERNEKLLAMHMKADEDPDYDDTELNRLVIDELIANPNFADLKHVLEDMKAGVLTKEEQAELNAQVKEEMQPEFDDLMAAQIMEMRQKMQGLIDDPELAECRDDMIDIQNRFTDLKDFDDPAFKERWSAVAAKLDTLPAFQRRMAEIKNEEDRMGRAVGNFPEALMDDEDKPIKSVEDVNELMRNMKGVIQAMGGDEDLENELESIINEGPSGTDEIDELAEFDEDGNGLNLDELANKINQLKNSPPVEEIDEEEKNLSPEMRAKIDKIMADPQLLEKLALMKQIIRQKQHPDEPDLPCAPEPSTLDSSRLTTYEQRLREAENDPEHLAALRRLRINLLPPFNVSPALKSLNRALKLSYLGASDDARRILWRSYSKARTVPTLLANIPDDAWDMIWYSQAVNWGSNENRRKHLQILTQDLRAVGRDGPPTPAEHLEDETA